MPCDPRHLFFFNDTATTEIYTLSLHDALPISTAPARWLGRAFSWWVTHPGLWIPSPARVWPPGWSKPGRLDRKSTRLNSSHDQISYADFCLKKKNWDYHKTPLIGRQPT